MENYYNALEKNDIKKIHCFLDYHEDEMCVSDINEGLYHLCKKYTDKLKNYTIYRFLRLGASPFFALWGICESNNLTDKHKNIINLLINYKNDYYDNIDLDKVLGLCLECNINKNTIKYIISLGGKINYKLSCDEFKIYLLCLLEVKISDKLNCVYLPFSDDVYFEIINYL
jgi:hypothetical protein